MSTEANKRKRGNEAATSGRKAKTRRGRGGKGTWKLVGNELNNICVMGNLHDI